MDIKPEIVKLKVGQQILADKKKGDNIIKLSGSVQGYIKCIKRTKDGYTIGFGDVISFPKIELYKTKEKGKK